MTGISREEIAALVVSVDYTEALTITSGAHEARRACEHAKQYGFRAVVTYPQYVDVVAKELDKTGILTQLPVGYPSGGNTTYTKCRETEDGLKRGATDVDMVMNISEFKNGNYHKVEEEVSEILDIVKTFSPNIPFKVIVETGVLTENEKIEAAKLVADSGADFIKTSTGVGPGRATVHDIMTIKKVVQDRVKIKASGSVASIEDGIAFMRAGASVVALRGFVVEQLREMGW